MIMVDHEIRQALESGDIKVSPFNPELLNPASLDVCLGGNFRVLELTENSRPYSVGFKEGTCAVPQDPTTFHFKCWDGDSYVLLPQHFVIASLLEDITLSDDICAEIRGKSSLGRLGLMQSSCAGFADNSWSGVLTIELYNYSQCPLLLTKGMKIGQILFHRTSVCDRGYNETGRYYRQEPGQGSKGV